MSKDDLGRRALAPRRIQRCTIYRVAARRVSSVGPVEHSAPGIQIEVDRLGQLVVEQLDVRAVRRRLPLRYVEVRSQDAALARVVFTFLGPVELAGIRVDGDAHAPLACNRTGSRVALAGVDERLDVRAVQIGT